MSAKDEIRGVFQKEKDRPESLSFYRQANQSKASVKASCLFLYPRRRLVLGHYQQAVLAAYQAFHVPALAVAPRVVVPLAVAVALHVAAVARVAHPPGVVARVSSVRPVAQAVLTVAQLEAAAHPGGVAVHAHAEHPAGRVA